MIYNTCTYIIHILRIFITVLYYGISPSVLVHIIMYICISLLFVDVTINKNNTQVYVCSWWINYYRIFKLKECRKIYIYSGGKIFMIFIIEKGNDESRIRY